MKRLSVLRSMKIIIPVNKIKLSMLIIKIAISLDNDLVTNQYRNPLSIRIIHDPNNPNNAAALCLTTSAGFLYSNLGTKRLMIDPNELTTKDSDVVKTIMQSRVSAVISNV